MKTIVLAVTNDLAHDQRVLRIISTLIKSGSNIVFIGRKFRDSSDFSPRDFKTVRFRLLFKRKFLFYAEFNIRLFCYLLFKKADVLVANDLDTLPAMYLASLLKSRPLVYDSHEYFTGVYEISGRPFVKKFWDRIERRIVPGLKYFMTVNNSIAGLYKEKYGIHPVVVRNFAKYRDHITYPEKLPVQLINKKYFVIQGTGLNIGRGIEEAVLAMKQVDDCSLAIVGRGLVLDHVKQMVKEEGLQEKVFLLDPLSYEELMYITASAVAGLSLDKPLAENYLYSLPNKISDYIQARIPLIVSDLPEVSSIITMYGTGLVCRSVDPDSIAQCMNLILNDKKLSESFRINSEKAALEICWEKEEVRVVELYKKVGITFNE